MFGRLGTVLWHSAFEPDCDVVDRFFAIANGLGPFLRDLVDRHEDQHERRISLGLFLAVAGKLADHVV